MRIQRENDAKRISEAIDEGLREDRERLKRAKGDVKVGLCYLVLFTLSS
jgi:hypothetical protein